MDPDACLAELRRIAERVTRESPTTDALERAAELFLALDVWLTNGGFLPEDWQP